MLIACELKEEFANKQTENPCIIVGFTVVFLSFKHVFKRLCLAFCVVLVYGMGYCPLQC